MNNEEDDEVVEELDVVLGGGQGGESRLLLAQFPLVGPGSSRTTLRSALHSPSLQGSVQATSRRFRLRLPLPASEPTFDPHKAAALGPGAEFQTLESTNNGGFLRHAYAIARVSNGKLFLEPVDACVQFRPSLAYLNEAKTGVGAAATKSGEGESSQEDSEPETRSVQVRFSRETDQSRRRRAKAVTVDAEPWLPLHFEQPSSTSLRDLCQELSRLEPTQPFPSLSPTSIARTLIPPPKEQTRDTDAAPPAVLSLSALRKMPLEEQVQKLLMNAKVMPYGQLRSLLGVGLAEEERLLSLLSSLAFLVRGVWVVSSVLLYPDTPDDRKPTGPSPSLMRNARDFILYRLQSETWLQRRDVTTAVRLRSEDLGQLLTGVARFRPSKGFTFPFPDDTDFLASYPTLVAAEAAKWERRWIELREWVRANAEAAAAAAPLKRQKSLSGRRRNASHRSSQEGEPETGEIKRGAKRRLPEEKENGLSEVSEESVSGLREFLFQRFSECAVLSPADAERLLVQKERESPMPASLAALPRPIPVGLFRKAGESMGAKTVRTKEGEGHQRIFCPLVRHSKKVLVLKDASSGLEAEEFGQRRGCSWWTGCRRRADSGSRHSEKPFIVPPMFPTPSRLTRSSKTFCCNTVNSKTEPIVF